MTEEDQGFSSGTSSIKTGRQLLVCSLNFRRHKKPTTPRRCRFACPLAGILQRRTFGPLIDLPQLKVATNCRCLLGLPSSSFRVFANSIQPRLTTGAPRVFGFLKLEDKKMEE